MINNWFVSFNLWSCFGDDDDDNMLDQREGRKNWLSMNKLRRWRFINVLTTYYMKKEEDWIKVLVELANLSNH